VEDVRPYLPPERTGHVIVTSRNPNWDVVGRPFALRPMKRNEAVDFLLKRTGKKKMDGAVGALAQALGTLSDSQLRDVMEVGLGRTYIASPYSASTSVNPSVTAAIISGAAAVDDPALKARVFEIGSQHASTQFLIAD
jgi:hypothetical protein